MRREIRRVPIPSGGTVLVRLNNDDLDGDRCSQEVDHLLVGQSRHRHFADLHQPAALSQPSLPCVTEGLNIGYDSFKVDVESELAQTVPAQGHFCGLTSPRHHLHQHTKRETTWAKIIVRLCCLQNFYTFHSVLRICKRASFFILWKWKELWWCREGSVHLQWECEMRPRGKRSTHSPVLCSTMTRGSLKRFYFTREWRLITTLRPAGRGKQICVRT